ncbi:MAG: hypothetical protein JXA54_05400 [Candidatus Heimdallarchaeota archaeon]|nr:hypothetical protein [Candidatus Heimdallarchaeota archaeon]
MNSSNKQSKKQKRVENFASFSKAVGLGLAQGGICSLLGILLMMINDYVIFSVLAIWLIFGWFSSYLISIRTLEIVTLLLTNAFISSLVYYLSNIQFWFISVLTGISIIFWSISFTSKILLYPAKRSHDQLEDEIKSQNKT